MPPDPRASPLAPDFSHRAQLTEMMDEPCPRDELRACLRDLDRLNRWFLGDRPLFAWLKKVAANSRTPLCILDVGCGDGQTLRKIYRWARRNQFSVQLLGLDLNPETVAIASEVTPPNMHIEWIADNIFDFKPTQPIDLVISSLMTHHLNDPQIIGFLRWMERNARRGWFINDLSRAAFPFHFLRIFTRLARLHPFVQNDAPISVARAFIQDDWYQLCAQASLAPSQVTIREYKPARLCVSRTKPQ